MKATRRFHLTVLLGSGTILLQGCPAGALVGGLLSECFDENSISQREFEDLNALEQLLYDENDCGRYEPRSSFLDDIL